MLLLVCGFPTFYQYIFIEKPEYVFILITYIIYYLMIIVLFLLCCFADSPPNYNLLTETPDEESRKSSPEVNASFLSKLTFWWFNSLAILGYKKSLVTSDLYDLNEDDKSNTICSEFDKNWLKQLPKNERSNELNSINFVPDHINESNNLPGVLRTLISTFGCLFLSGVVIRLGCDLLQFASPLLLK